MLLSKYNRFLLFSSLLVSVLFFACHTKPATKSTIATPKPEPANVAPALETQILNLVNQHRQSKGLAPLQMNIVISAEARKHSLNMATKRVAFGHTGLSVRTKNITSKLKSVTSVAENVANGSLTPQEVVRLWLSSDGHRKNMEGNYSLTGIGVARNQNSQLYFTEIFAR